MNKKYEILKNLFLSTLFISAFTFGGGYVIVSLMKKKFVDELHWINEEEMLDLTAIAQASPGAIAVNGSIAVGYKLCGIPGIAVAIIATILPPFIIISIISFFYNEFRSNEAVSFILEGMQLGVAAVIASVSYDMSGAVLKDKNKFLFIIMSVTFILNYFLNVSVIYIIIICILIGSFQYMYERYRK